MLYPASEEKMPDNMDELAREQTRQIMAAESELSHSNSNDLQMRDDLGNSVVAVSARM
jgi:hypothetical protein